LFHRFSIIIQGILSFGGFWPDSSRWESLSNSVQEFHVFGSVNGLGDPPRSYGSGPAIWTSIEQLPKDTEYDFIIVGGERETLRVFFNPLLFFLLFLA
jgi:hypothetical protein